MHFGPDFSVCLGDAQTRYRWIVWRCLVALKATTASTMNAIRRSYGAMKHWGETAGKLYDVVMVVAGQHIPCNRGKFFTRHCGANVCGATTNEVGGGVMCHT